MMRANTDGTMDWTYARRRTDVPRDRIAEQWCADVNEDVEIQRYPSRVLLLRAINDAARRADCRARLEQILARPQGAL